MEPSEEIRRVIHRWMAATSGGDADAVLARVSEHPGAVTIGTDADEWWHGHDAHPVWRRQLVGDGRVSFPITWRTQVTGSSRSISPERVPAHSGFRQTL